MTNEMKVLRMNLLGGMNQYIIELGDEDIYERWIRLIPDECDEEDIEIIATDDELWAVACALFGKLVKETDGKDSILRYAE